MWRHRTTATSMPWGNLLFSIFHFLGVGGPRRVTLHYNDWRGSFGSSPMVGGLRFDITPRSWRKQETNWNKILPDARWILKGRGLRKCGVPEQDCLVSELSSGVTQCHFLLGETEKLVSSVCRCTENYSSIISDFRVAVRFCFKASPSAKPFIWKLDLFTCKWTKICVSKTNFHMKGFGLGLALKQRQRKGNSEIAYRVLETWPELSAAFRLVSRFMAWFERSRNVLLIHSFIKHVPLQNTVLLQHMARHSLFSLFVWSVVTL